MINNKKELVIVQDLEYVCFERDQRTNDDHDVQVYHKPRQIRNEISKEMKTNIYFLTIPNSTISSIKSASRPRIAS